MKGLVDGSGRSSAVAVPYGVVFTPDYKFLVMNKGIALRNLLSLTTSLKIGQVISKFQAVVADPTDDLYKEIDSMDEVEIYLTGIGGTPEKVFTGFVDSTERAYAAGTQHRVKIGGSTPFKLFHITSLDQETIDLRATGYLKVGRKSAEIVQDFAERVGIPRQDIVISLKDDYDVQLLPDAAKPLSLFHPDYAKFSSLLASIAIAASHEFFFDEQGRLIYRDVPYFQSPATRITDDLIQNVTVKRDDAPYVTHVHVYGMAMVGGIKVQGHAELDEIELDIPIDMGKYRERRIVINCPWIQHPDAARAHALFMLETLNASMISGAVTVPGLPRVKLGESVEITSFEKIYYVSSIQHIYQEGQSFMTTLGLSYGRPIGGNWRVLGRNVTVTPAGNTVETYTYWMEVERGELLLERGETVSGFEVPLPGGSYWVSDVFNSFQIWRSRPHQGIDLAAPGGTPIYATRAGIVQESGWHDGYGWRVEVLHNDGYTTLYGHMPRQPPVQVGQAVDAGGEIGVVGNTGFTSANGYHLHFEVTDENGNPVDPENYLDF